MPGIKDCKPDVFVAKLAAHLKNERKLTPGAWTIFAKTAAAKVISPTDQDWYYIRAASMLRQAYNKGSLGTNACRNLYGCAKNGKSVPHHFSLASGKIHREILRGLVSAGYMKVEDRNDQCPRRVLSPQGKRALEQLAHSLK